MAAKMSHLANLIHRPRDSDFVPSNITQTSHAANLINRPHDSDFVPSNTAQNESSNTAQKSAQSSHPANLNH
jgi:hypothetical protein